MNAKVKQIDIKILDYSPEYATFFEQLNRRWIERYFEMEPLDYLLLQNPESEIIHKGGTVLFAATESGEIVGTVALKNDGNGVFELAKMAVDEKSRGLGIGQILGEAVLRRASEMGARKVYLHTNSRLHPAINLYRKLGFQQVPVTGDDYARVDIEMEIEFGANSNRDQAGKQN